MGWQDNTFELVIVKGTAGGVFVYDSSGNLVASMADLADVDPITHSNLAGIVSQLTDVAYAQLLNGFLALGSLEAATRLTRPAGVSLIEQLTDSGQQAMVISSPSTQALVGAGQSVIWVLGESKDGTKPQQILIASTITAIPAPETTALTEIQGAAAADSLWVPAGDIPVGTAPAGAETWHAVTFQNGWANTAGRTNAQYRLVASPPRSTEITGCVTVPVGFAIGQVIFNLPANYRPASPGSVIGIDITTNAIVHLGYGTGGNITYQGGAGAAGDEIDFWALINRDA